MKIECNGFIFKKALNFLFTVGSIVQPNREFYLFQNLLILCRVFRNVFYFNLTSLLLFLLLFYTTCIHVILTKQMTNQSETKKVTEERITKYYKCNTVTLKGVIKDKNVKIIVVTIVIIKICFSEKVKCI